MSETTDKLRESLLEKIRKNVENFQQQAGFRLARELEHYQLQIRNDCYVEAFQPAGLTITFNQLSPVKAAVVVRTLVPMPISLIEAMQYGGVALQVVLTHCIQHGFIVPVNQVNFTHPFDGDIVPSLTTTFIGYSEYQPLALALAKLAEDYKHPIGKRKEGDIPAEQFNAIVTCLRRIVSNNYNIPSDMDVQRIRDYLDVYPGALMFLSFSRECTDPYSHVVVTNLGGEEVVIPVLRPDLADATSRLDKVELARRMAHSKYVAVMAHADHASAKSMPSTYWQPRRALRIVK